MTGYERELERAEGLGLKVTEGFHFKSGIKGFIIGRHVFISEKLSTDSERACVLREEIAHFELNCGDISDQSRAECRRQEHRAHRRMVTDSLPIEDIVMAAVRAGEGAGINDVAEDLGVTVEFLSEAFDVYAGSLGGRAEVMGYVVEFGPFRVVGRNSAGADY